MTRRYLIAAEIGNSNGIQHSLEGPWFDNDKQADEYAEGVLKRLKRIYRQVAVHVLRLERTFR